MNKELAEFADLFEDGEKGRPEVDPSALARMMLQYEQKYKILKELERAIEASIFRLKETQKVGNVTAKYSKGRKSYKYKEAVESHDVSQQIIDEHTTIRKYYSWSKICEDAGIDKDSIEFEVGDPKVSISVKEN